MRLPTAEFIALFAATSQLSSPSLQGAKFSLLDEPACNRSYKVKSGDICNSIAENNDAPTYQIMCQNDQIDGKCSNLSPGEKICLGRQGEDCKNTYVVRWPDSAQSIADQFNIPLGVFEENNYCYDSGAGKICPPFNDGTVVCVARHRIGDTEQCAKIFARVF